MREPDDPLRHRREEELALAEQLADLHERGMALPASPIEVAAFRHRAGSSGVSLAAIRNGRAGTLQIDIADASGLGPVGGMLAALAILERLRQTATADLVESNRHFLEHPPSERAMLAAATLEFEFDSLDWTGTFAGLPAPILVDDSGLVEVLMGTGPFLGLTETTFPTIRGLFHPGKRLFLLAGANAGNLCPALCERLPDTRHLPLRVLVERLGRALVAELEPGFGVLLLGIERRILSEPQA